MIWLDSWLYAKRVLFTFPLGIFRDRALPRDRVSSRSSSTERFTRAFDVKSTVFTKLSFELRSQQKKLQWYDEHMLICSNGFFGSHSEMNKKIREKLKIRALIKINMAHHAFALSAPHSVCVDNFPSNNLLRSDSQVFFMNLTRKRRTNIF